MKKIGDTIKLKKEHAEFISESFKKSSAIELEIDAMCSRIFQNRTEIWKFIYETHPELKEFNLSHSHKDNSLIIIGNKEN